MCFGLLLIQAYLFLTRIVKNFSWPSSLPSAISWLFSTILFVVVFLHLTVLVEVGCRFEVAHPNTAKCCEWEWWKAFLTQWPKEVNPLWKEENPPSKDRNPLKAEKNKPGSQLLFLWRHLWFPKKSLNVIFYRSWIEICSFYQKFPEDII